MIAKSSLTRNNCADRKGKAADMCRDTKEANIVSSRSTALSLLYSNEIKTTFLVLEGNLYDACNSIFCTNT